MDDIYLTPNRPTELADFPIDKGEVIPYPSLYSRGRTVARPGWGSQKRFINDYTKVSFFLKITKFFFGLFNGFQILI